VALVTGSGQGLGKAICQELATAGALVIAGDVNQTANAQCVLEIAGAGGRAVALHLDVGEEDQVRDAIGKLKEEHGHLDILINNAGVDKTVSIEELTVTEWDCILRVNLRGPFVLSKYALPVMREQGGGHIVNIASTAAKRAWANAAAYHASKWGLLGFSHALHVEGRKDNIKVTAVLAGGMRTPFLLDRFPDLDVNLLQDPANVAKTVRFVLSQPAETVIPEVMVLPMRETSWP